MVERRDEVSGGHAERTCKYMEVLLDVLVKNNVYEDVIKSGQKDLFLQSAVLYDLGKISVKDTILLKPEKLAENEYDEIKKHTLMGVKIIEDIKAGMTDNSVETSILDYAKVFAGFHHEKWDGTGYPYGLKGYNIPLPGRLMAIVDVYGALIVKRPYKMFHGGGPVQSNREPIAAPYPQFGASPALTLGPKRIQPVMRRKICYTTRPY
jgi:putative two-component system response regulator